MMNAILIGWWRDDWSIQTAPSMAMPEMRPAPQDAGGVRRHAEKCKYCEPELEGQVKFDGRSQPDEDRPLH